jgi:TetR/AcrR family transcriptional repressor of nem operon
MMVETETLDVRRSILAIARPIIGAKGFSAVGLTEILAAAKIPKGSFYHYFNSKETFGVDLLDHYFVEYLAELDLILAGPGLPMAERLMAYWRNWRASQASFDCQGKCLAVKLGAEVADLSEPMRLSLQRGTSSIVDRLTMAIEAGVAEGSLAVDEAPRTVAESLYYLWLGASVMTKITRSLHALDTALLTTQRILHLPSSRLV